MRNYNSEIEAINKNLRASKDVHTTNQLMKLKNNILEEQKKEKEEAALKNSSEDYNEQLEILKKVRLVKMVRAMRANKR